MDSSSGNKTSFMSLLSPINAQGWDKNNPNKIKFEFSEVGVESPGGEVVLVVTREEEGDSLVVTREEEGDSLVVRTTINVQLEAMQGGGPQGCTRRGSGSCS